ncbi:MFS transporter [Agromyces archimandritae]|uniref:MFS transporter n=1 Tax=Agromyces archimandritae TaxID=2781962 RepID=A0A975FQ28_9MICO|nr:MFS transporter [Agromyces archimandritae]QTX06204.1 MFS transporter [Agromyces archimandritae]
MRGFWAALPTEGRWLLSTVVITTFGRGLTLPFTIIYLSEVRGFDLGFSGLLMSLIAVTGLIVTAPSGALTDRFGARAVLLASLVSMIAGCTLLAYATHPLTATIAVCLIGVNFGASWPANNALIAHVVDGELRQRYFGVNFALVNLGIGFGGIIGGLFIDVADPFTFTLIFLIDAVSCFVPIALLLGPLRRVHTVPAPVEGEGPAASVGYLHLLRQPAVRWMTLLSFLAVFVGYGQFEAGFPAYARGVAEVSTQTIGFAFAVNTAVIVLLQFTVLNRIAGHRRTRVLIVMALIWTVSWMLLGTAGLLPGSWAAVAGVLAFTGVFAFGETLMQPSIPAIVNDLADDRSRGRANAVNSASFQAGAILGPVVAGLLLDHGLSGIYIAVMVAGCLGVAVLALVLERRLPAHANGVPAAAAASPAAE